MEEQVGHRVWLPVVVTFTVWMALIFVIDALVSRMWADLIGLFYLMVSPFIYRNLKSMVAVDTADSESSSEQSRMMNTGQ